MRYAALILCALPVVVSILGACGGGVGSGFGGTGDTADGGASGATDGATSSTDSSGTFTMHDGSSANDTSPPAPVAVVYAHSADVLYKLDPTSKAVSVVGPFVGCSSVIDIAIDQAGDAFVTTTGALYKLNLATATCSHVAGGSYPNSLSFVPKGTLDPNAEALVGYVGSDYVRIDTSSGSVTTIGGLTGGYQSSGDIVSVIGGGTFLTVNGNGCGDCLLQIDPKTGDLVQSYGSVAHSAVYGLAYWAGTVYGFDDAGDVFSITWQNNTIVTTSIPVPNPPAGLEFWGAGSTTSAPVAAEDGGGIPIK